MHPHKKSRHDDNLMNASKDLRRNERNKQDHYSYVMHSVTSTKKKRVTSNINFTTLSINKRNNTTASSTEQVKKWQVGRVSRKHYEVINMLWRKTKIFVNVEDTTTGYRHFNRNTTITMKKTVFPMYTIPNPILQTSTPSYIEFYYLDEIDDRLKQKDFANPKTLKLDDNLRYNRGLRSNKFGNLRFVLPSGPMFAFHVNDPYYKRAPVTQSTNKGRKRFHIRRYPLLDLKDYVNFDVTPLPDKKIDTTNTKHAYRIHMINTRKYVSSNTSNDSEFLLKNNIQLLAFNNINDNESKTEIYYSTTANDKIKFFELYDWHTRIAYNVNKSKGYASEDLYDEKYDNEALNTDGKILLGHVDQSGHDNNHTMKYVKKHIVEQFADKANHTNDHKVIPKNLLSLSALFNKTIKDNITAARNAFININKAPIKPLQKYENESKTVLWSDFPFAAVYIHESAQVHCDAAGISPHWLVAAGSCLSRYQKSPAGQGRSAFVAYCGDSWWQPERVAYVKYSLVHPRFHPRDRTRRHLYNIGLIQVVSSMASACTGWAPITLMSHQFAAEKDGSTAYALGWGLDRFDVRFSSPELPKESLKLYKGIIFSDSCPGYTENSKARHNERGRFKNVFCLGLPPYQGEENDPVHGSILLVGEKLIALYLQEERRPRGEQAAQYTGTWRLTPWVLDVAREPDEGESFMVEV